MIETSPHLYLCPMRHIAYGVLVRSLTQSNRTRETTGIRVIRFEVRRYRCAFKLSQTIQQEASSTRCIRQLIHCRGRRLVITI